MQEKSIILPIIFLIELEIYIIIAILMIDMLVGVS